MEPPDLSAWIGLAAQVAVLFDSPGMARDPAFRAYADKKILLREAVGAFDRRTGMCLGVLSFSRKTNRIAWMAVLQERRGQGIGSRLLQTAIRHMDGDRPVDVITFLPGHPGGAPARALYLSAGFRDTGEDCTDGDGHARSLLVRPPDGGHRGQSFHYDYPRYESMSNPDTCPVCSGQQSPNPPVLLASFPFGRVECFEAAQGRLFGKCHVLACDHGLHFSAMPPDRAAGFIQDVQRAGDALLRVTGAVRINYEIHANSMPHLHAHLFPRYLDDDFPSAPIDYRLVDPSPYDPGEFDWFVTRMREMLAEPTAAQAPQIEQSVLAQEKETS
jgi:GNAT superfamily N-acetyltransferase/diadenosine tetraphosphate (Ap4A) HIT family hydrolase